MGPCLKYTSSFCSKHQPQGAHLYRVIALHHHPHKKPDQVPASCQRVTTQVQSMVSRNTTFFRFTGQISSTLWPKFTEHRGMKLGTIFTWEYPIYRHRSDDFFNPLLWNWPISFSCSIGNKKGIHSSTKYHQGAAKATEAFSCELLVSICVRVEFQRSRCTSRGKHDALRESHDATSHLYHHPPLSVLSLFCNQSVFNTCLIDELQRLSILLGCRWLISWDVPPHPKATQNTQLVHRLSKRRPIPVPYLSNRIIIFEYPGSIRAHQIVIISTNNMWSANGH